jgi:hypothetical protein
LTFVGLPAPFVTARTRGEEEAPQIPTDRPPTAAEIRSARQSIAQRQERQRARQEQTRAVARIQAANRARAGAGGRSRPAARIRRRGGARGDTAIDNRSTLNLNINGAADRGTINQVRSVVRGELQRQIGSLDALQQEAPAS